jgi:hypothetical protein
MHEDIERLAADELAKIDRDCRALERLRDDPVFILLRDARLSGITRERWEAASAAVVSATSRLAKSRGIVGDAVRLLRADPPDPAGAELLLRGRSVPLTPAETPKEDRRRPASSSTEPRFTLHAVKDFVADDLRAAQRVVEGAAAVLAAVRPRLEQLTVRLGEAGAGSRPGLATAGGTGPELAALRRAVDDAWRLLAADPLAFGAAGAPGPDGHGRLDLSRLDAIDAELTRLRAGQVARRADETFDETFDERDLLRARLKTYRLRACRHGHASQPELVALHERARQLLEAIPCDLRLAGEAVREYMAMERRSAGEDER